MNPDGHEYTARTTPRDHDPAETVNTRPNTVLDEAMAQAWQAGWRAAQRESWKYENAQDDTNPYDQRYNGNDR